MPRMGGRITTRRPVRTAKTGSSDPIATRTLGQRETTRCRAAHPSTAAQEHNPSPIAHPPQDTSSQEILNSALKATVTEIAAVTTQANPRAGIEQTVARRRRRRTRIRVTWTGRARNARSPPCERPASAPTMNRIGAARSCSPGLTQPPMVKMPTTTPPAATPPAMAHERTTLPQAPASPARASLSAAVACVMNGGRTMPSLRASSHPAGSAPVPIY